MNIVLSRGITYRSLLPASMNGNRLEPSTRSPEERIECRLEGSSVAKFRVFSLPSAAGYMKLSIMMPFFDMKSIVCSRPKSLDLRNPRFWSADSRLYMIVKVFIISGLAVAIEQI